ncbi:MCE family protein [bacterium]|nr:MCE family protein [bacterium]
MTVTRRQKINLGIFITVSTALFCLVLFLLVGLALFENRDLYLVRFSAKNISMSGLEVGSAVKYSGIQIGRVSEIRVDPQDVSIIIVGLEVNGDTPIAQDSVASLGSIGITGLKYIELSRGSPTARLRQPGEEIPAGPSFLDEITGQATVIAHKTEMLLNRLNAFLDEERQRSFWDTFDQMKQLVSTADQTLSGARPGLVELTTRSGAIAQDIEDLANTFQALLAELTPSLKTMVISSQELVRNIEQSRFKLDLLLEETKQTMAALHQNLGDTGLNASITKMNTLLDQSSLLLRQGKEDIHITLEHLRETAENLDEFSILIRENPSLLLRTQEAEERDIK